MSQALGVLQWLSAPRAAIDEEYMANQAPIDDWGLRLGSKVLWLKNDYMKTPQLDSEGQPVTKPATGEPVFSGFMNGSLGVINQAKAKGPRLVLDDGAEDFITSADLEKMTPG